MSKLSRLVAKSTYFGLNKITSCTSLPGKLAYKFDSNTLNKLSIDGSNVVIFVMGTNGKSTITNYLYNCIKVLSPKKNIVSNINGANMYQGILTTLLLNQKKNVLKDSIILIEVDELTMPNLIRDGLVPDYVLINNIFDDQVDRYSSKENLVAKIKDTLLSIDSKEVKLLINRDDPSLMPFYELDNILLMTFSVQPSTVDYSSVISKDDLVFDYINYDNIGRFNKPLSVKPLKTTFLTTYNGKSNNVGINYLFEVVSDDLNIDLSNTDMWFSFNIGKNTIFNIYNSTATLSMLFILISDMVFGDEIELDLFKIGNAINNTFVDGRMERFNLKNSTVAHLNLVKNNTGANLTLSEYSKILSDSKCDLVINFGNTPADGKDLSWVRDIDFSLVESDNLKGIYLVGENSKEISSYLKENNSFNNDSVKFYFLSRLNDLKTRNNILFLANFSKLKPSIKFLKKNSYEI